MNLHTIKTRRSALSLLFAVLWMLIPLTQVEASSVGAAGTFAGRNYVVQTGTNLENTGTHFNFINNFDTTITVDFSFEAPLGVSINVPSTPQEIAPGGTYRFEVSIFTSQNTPVGNFPITIVGRVISSAGGVEVSGSAGLNAILTVQGVPPTADPLLSIVSVTQNSFTIQFTNQDNGTVQILYALETQNFNLGEVISDLGGGDSQNVTFTDYLGSGIQPNTIYTVFAQSISSRENSQIVSIQVTTPPAPPPAPDPDPEDPDPTDPPVTDPDPTPPTTPPTTTPPATGGGGGSISLANVLVIELEYQELTLQVFDLYQPPKLNAYVSVRNNIREQSRIDLTNRVEISGEVNQNVTGQYVVTYTLRYTNLTLVETVTVRVVDTVAPQIVSPSVVNLRVNDPFTYRLVVTDNYDQPEDLIITGFPTQVDTSVVGSERFTIFVSDRSGNRTPFLLTVNVRERESTSIIVRINDIDVEFEAIEGLFNTNNYRVEVAVAVNQPLTNSPSWTLFTGQTLEASGRELVYVRLTDNLGNVLLGVLDVNTGRILPLLPDDNIITGDPWWRVLFRSGNIVVWIVPVIILLAGWIWFFFFLAKRRKKKEEEVQPVAVKPVVEKPRKADTVIPSISEVVQPPVKTKSKTDKLVPPKRTVKVDEVEVTLEPLIQEPVRPAKPVVAAKAKPAAEEKPVKPTRKRRKPKQEVYAQVVALEQEGIMDDDLLGLEVLSSSKKTIKEVLPEEQTIETTPTIVDEKQIDIFSEIGEEPPKPKRKKKDS